MMTSAVLLTQLAVGTATQLASPLATAFGVQFSVPGLALTTSADGIRGVTAAAAVKRGEALLSIPFASCLNVPRGPDDDVELSTALLKATADGDSPWSAYRTTLLPEATGAAFTWVVDEIERLQLEKAREQASALRDRCEDAFADYDQLDDTVRALGLEEWKWAVSMVYSRSFTIDDGSGPRRVLAPFLDLFNHQPESPAEYAAASNAWEADGYDEPPSPWRLNLGDDDHHGESCRLWLHADHDAPSGAELRLPYGIETSAELLATSGFVPAQGNSAEYIPLYTDVIELIGTCAYAIGMAEPAQKARLSILSELEAAEAPLGVRPGGRGACAHVINCVRLVVASEDELSEFEEQYDETLGHYTIVLAAAAKADSAATELTPRRHEVLDARAAYLCAQAAGATLDELPTSLEDDLTALAAFDAEVGAADGSDASVRARAACALRYRIGAKQLLTSFAESCDEVVAAAEEAYGTLGDEQGAPWPPERAPGAA